MNISCPIVTPTPVISTPKPCENNQILKDCVKGCNKDCNNLGESCDSEEVCKVSKCGCSEGLFNNGSHCVPASSCECKDIANVVHQPGDSWNYGCSRCTCFNNSITCSLKKCNPPICPPVGYILVNKEDLCCPICEKDPTTSMQGRGF